jgi:hypothetical protein
VKAEKWDTMLTKLLLGFSVNMAKKTKKRDFLIVVDSFQQ